MATPRLAAPDEFQEVGHLRGQVHFLLHPGARGLEVAPAEEEQAEGLAQGGNVGGSQTGPLQPHEIDPLDRVGIVDNGVRAEGPGRPGSRPA